MSYHAGDTGRLWLKLASDNSFMHTKHIQSWSFTWNQDMLPIDRLSSTDKSFYPGLKSLTGNCKIFYYRDDNAGLDKGDESAAWILEKIFKTDGSGGSINSGDSPELEFQLGFKEAAANKFIRFQAYITSYTLGASSGEVSSADISFQMNGTPLENTL